MQEARNVLPGTDSFLEANYVVWLQDAGVAAADVWKGWQQQSAALASLAAGLLLL